MSGDISRDSFVPERGYTSVRLQQGRVLLDADWNEQADLLRGALRDAIADLVGDGASEAGDGFCPRIGSIGSDAAEGELVLGPGTLFVGGNRVENGRDLSVLDVDDGVPEVDREALEDGTAVLYLETWEVERTAVDDARIGEPELGEAESSTRTERFWRPRLLPLVDVLPSTFEPQNIASLHEWQAELKARSDQARLDVRVADSESSVESAVYRVQVHSVSAEQVCLLWSRANGSVQMRVSEVIEHGRVTVLRVAGLAQRGHEIDRDDWIELLSDEWPRLPGKGTLAQVAFVDAPDEKLGIKISLGAEAPVAIRQWNARLELPQRGRWIPLERGIEVQLSTDGGLVPGDYWNFATREGRGVDWGDGFGVGGGSPRCPDGVVRDVVPLAVVERKAGRWIIRHDLRQRFRPLTDEYRRGEEYRRAVEALLAERDAEWRARFEALEKRVEKGLEQLEDGVQRLEQATGRHSFDYGGDRLLLPQYVAAMAADGSGVELLGAADRRRLLGVIDEIDEGARRCRVVVHGRTRVRVVGPVEIGDLLIPSQREGHAQRAGFYIRPGTLLGKALSSHEGGGEPGAVDVLVMLG